MFGVHSSVEPSHLTSPLSLPVTFARPFADTGVTMALASPTCESDFLLLGLQAGEEYLTPVRTAATLAVTTVAFGWCSSEKIKRLGLFFAHWLS